MKEIKKILILGLGAIGSIYATKLHDYSPECVNVLLDKSRVESYKKNGIIFNKKRYDFEYLLDTDILYKFDLIIIATKSPSFNQAVEMIKNFVSEKTIIMSLLNGISSEETLIQKYGAEKVLYSYFLGHPSMKSGNNIVFDGVGDIFFGEAVSRHSENVLAVKDFFDKVGISYQIHSDMTSSMWQKFVINIGANQPLALVRRPYEAFKTSKYVRNISYDLMSEAVNIAQKLDIKDADKFIDRTFDVLYSMPAGQKPSMLQDIENGSETEIDIFAGEVCRLGKIHGIFTPKNRIVFNILKSIDETAVKEYLITAKN